MISYDVYYKMKNLYQSEKILYKKTSSCKNSWKMVNNIFYNDNRYITEFNIYFYTTRKVKLIMGQLGGEKEM